MKSPNAEAVFRHENKQREKGRIQRKKWAHKEDWPRITAYIDRLNKQREKCNA